MINIPKRNEWLKRKSKWSLRMRKKNDKEPVVDVNFFRELKTDGDQEYPSPSRNMPSEIRYDSSPSSQISRISGTTELDPRPPPSIRSVVPLKAYQSSNPLPIHNKKNVIKLDPLNVKRDSLFPSISDSEDDSLFLNSVQSSGKNRLPRIPMQSAFRKIPKTKHPRWSATRLLEKIAYDTFDNVDSEKLGEIDKKNFLYAIVLVHLDLSTYLGPVIYRTLEKETVVSSFESRKRPTKELISREKFVEAAVFLYSDLIFNSLQQFIGVLIATCLSTPYLAWAISFFLRLIVSILECFFPFLPITFILGLSSYVTPHSIHNTFMSSCVSCLLGTVIIPFALHSQDDGKMVFKTIKRTVSLRLVNASESFFKTKC